MTVETTSSANQIAANNAAIQMRKAEARGLAVGDTVMVDGGVPDPWVGTVKTLHPTYISPCVRVAPYGEGGAKDVLLFADQCRKLTRAENERLHKA